MKRIQLAWLLSACMSLFLIQSSYAQFSIDDIPPEELEALSPEERAELEQFLASPDFAQMVEQLEQAEQEGRLEEALEELAPPASAPQEEIEEPEEQDVSDQQGVDAQEQTQEPAEIPAPEPVPEAPQFEAEPIAFPEPPEEIDLDAQEEPPLQIEGISTVELESPQGNWLYKRIWWERAERKYEKIRAGVQSIFESRMSFFTGRSEVDKKVLDPFYIATGFGQGEMQALLNELLGMLDEEREREGVLNAQQRAMLDLLQEQKETLEQLQKDVQAINQLDHSIDDALSQLMEQINRVRAYDRQAWQSFKEIARVLDDIKARELFYKVEASWRNIKDIRTYILGAFTQYFEQLTSSVREHVERVQNAVNALKEKGIDFKQDVKMLTEPQPQVCKPQVDIDEEDEDEDEDDMQVGIIGTITAYASSFFQTVLSYIRMPYDMIFGGGDADDFDDDDDDFDDE